MPVFLEKLVPPYMAVLLSVTLVLIFGEIIPSALFTGKNQILLAAKLSSFVWFLLYLLYPITYPISKVLDYVFGHDEESSFSRHELEALVILQNAACREEYDYIGNSYNSTSSELTRDEIGIMTGVLRLSQLTALDAMIPEHQVTKISSNVDLDAAALEKIMDIGFSRYPVFEQNDRGHLLGYLLVKKLIVVNPSDKRLVTSLELLEPIVVHPSEDLFEMLNIFQEGRSHLALVSNDPETTLRCIQEKIAPVSEQSKVLGIITLENIIEKIIQEEIYDETDQRGPLNARDKIEKLLQPKKEKEGLSNWRVNGRSLSQGGRGATSADTQKDTTSLLPQHSLSAASKYGTSSATPATRKRRTSLSVRPVLAEKDHSGTATTASTSHPPPLRIQRYSTFDTLRSLKTEALHRSNGGSKTLRGDITLGGVADPSP
jgi:Mg2+/Co2+ transporter CorC